MAWDWKEELGKLSLTQIVLGLSIPIGSLILIVFREILVEKWVQIMAGVSTRGLSAALGLALIAVVFELIIISSLLILLTRARKTIPEPPMSKRFGVLWDKELNPDLRLGHYQQRDRLESG